MILLFDIESDVPLKLFRFISESIFAETLPEEESTRINWYLVCE